MNNCVWEIWLCELSLDKDQMVLHCGSTSAQQIANNPISMNVQSTWRLIISHTEEQPEDFLTKVMPKRQLLDALSKLDIIDFYAQPWGRELWDSI